MAVSPALVKLMEATVGPKVWGKVAARVEGNTNDSQQNTSCRMWTEARGIHSGPCSNMSAPMLLSQAFVTQ